MAPDRDSQSVQFVEPGLPHRPGLAAGENDRFADQLGARLFERTEDRRGAKLHGWHGWLPSGRREHGRSLSSMMVRGGDDGTTLLRLYVGNATRGNRQRSRAVTIRIIQTDGLAASQQKSRQSACAESRQSRI